MQGSLSVAAVTAQKQTSRSLRWGALSVGMLRQELPLQTCLCSNLRVGLRCDSPKGHSAVAQCGIVRLLGSVVLQLSFMEAVVTPSFTSLATLAPTTSKTALDNIKKAQVCMHHGCRESVSAMNPLHLHLSSRRELHHGMWAAAVYRTRATLHGHKFNVLLVHTPKHWSSVICRRTGRPIRSLGRSGCRHRTKSTSRGRSR